MSEVMMKSNQPIFYLQSVYCFFSNALKPILICLINNFSVYLCTINSDEYGPFGTTFQNIIFF